MTHVHEPSLRKALKVCPVCGCSFSAKPSQIERRVYCSRECLAAAYRTRLVGPGNPHFSDASRRTCERCGGEFHSYSKSRRYCSQACYRAEPTPRTCRAVACAQCGATFRQRKSDQRFCGADCAREAASANRVCAKCGAHVGRKRFYCPACSPRRRPRQYCVECGRPFTHRIHKLTCSAACLSEHKSRTQRGELSHRWRGGRTSEVALCRNSHQYATWRKAVFSRDGFACQMCGGVGVKLAAHHILTFSEHPHLAFDTGNGITLCWPCHQSLRHHEDENVDALLAKTGGLNTWALAR